MTVTGGEIVAIVVVTVDSVNRGVDCERGTSGCETPIETFGQGAIMIGVVAWLQKSLIGGLAIMD